MIAAAPRPFVHLELHTPNLGAACLLYADLFRWRPQRIETAGATYHVLDLAPGASGGVVECGTERALSLPHVEERAIVALVQAVYGGMEQPTRDWLQRPGPGRVRAPLPLARGLYAELIGMELPDVMPPRERRTVDCVLSSSLRSAIERGPSSWTRRSSQLASLKRLR